MLSISGLPNLAADFWCNLATERSSRRFDSHSITGKPTQVDAVVQRNAMIHEPRTGEIHSLSKYALSFDERSRAWRGADLF